MSEPIKASDLLRQARARIERPELWCKMTPITATYPDGATCAMLAIWDLEVDSELRLHLQDMVRNVIPERQRKQGMFTWNDAPERTHAEVLAAFDRAIALAAAQDGLAG